MKRLITLAVLGCIVVISTGCENGASNTKSIESIHQENGVPVRIQKVSRNDNTNDLSWHTVLSGGMESSAKASVDDRVESVRYKVGDHVEKNTVIVTFPTDNPSARYLQAQVAYENAKTTLQRMQNLFESGGISQQELDNIRTQFKVSEANWKAAQEAIHVDAPISGVITQINVRETENVKPGAVLFTIADTRTLRAKLGVVESQAGQIHVGDKATAEYHGSILQGKVVQVDRSMNSQQQTYGVMIDFDNPGRRIASGSNVKVSIQADNADGSLFISRKYIQRENDKYYVYLADNGHAVKRAVQIGASIGTSMEVLQGLNEGDMLITASQMLLKDGSKILVVD